MGYEIDYLWVGEESKSGQAIVVRFGNLHGSRDEQTVMVIDGGFLETGDRIVEHVRNIYGTNRVDVVVSTHPDADHIKGLEKVLLELDVGRLWMHQPWNHAEALDKLFENASQVSPKVAEKVAKAIGAAQTLEVVAASQGVPVEEVFGPTQHFGGQILMLGPSPEFYAELLIEEGAETALKAAMHSILYGASDLLQAATAPVAKWLDESLEVETLTDEGVQSPMNESSMIFELRHGGKRVLFTADAGQRALTHAADVIDAYGLATQPYDLVQIPHHGSRRNVGPTILNRLVGSIGARPYGSWAACASAAVKGEPKHPAKKVLNAFTRRGGKTYVTRERSLRWWHDAPARPGWDSTPDPEPLFNKVEDDSA
jgi:beta-lactamase superfamily II metal-dependent hydrolase